ncbi:phosphatidylinositol 3 and 4-kinase-domain-containing protein [Emericellopsis atlantica]|uniref:Phosphatidylinositol 4-kinase n=1 Tax=Emericellopsis atlantica TaxID=2614577 RepID=A0A9P7ZX90_9HYPO|nr:phosphatidylinositol 3 and 4-kinase-domain-containing protein [Emericellopsis atlantica]KAG9259206.1 phosphatidylinositol 3 and 4-kinase-domain-containing protein [Emericellopsis atlantica]
MPRDRPATTGYERLAQADQLSDSDDDDLAIDQPSAALSAPRYAPISNPPRPSHRSGLHTPASSRPIIHHRSGSAAGVDLKAINARLERWADEIASRFKRGRGKHQVGEEERFEIHHSVFQPPEGVRPMSPEELGGLQVGHMAQSEFERIVDSVRTAIGQEIHPSMISQGSSGSYFARDPDGKIVGVFKPKDEEPYAAGNPKWNKWIHRNLFPCFFGRACLIPNLSYVSEAAAYVLDCQLRTHLVPYTDVVWLASKSFHYPFWDRRKFNRKKRPLPAKPGSFQVFLKGFKDANVFLRENPWPDQYWSGLRTNDAHRKKKKRWTENCRPSSRPPNDVSYSDDEDQLESDLSPSPERFVWTEPLKQSLREELEKLVVLDYIMRNTDRGLDNWMIKVDWETGKASIVSDPVRMNMEPVAEEEGPRPAQAGRSHSAGATPRAANPYKSHKPMEAKNREPAGNQPSIVIGAIDNSLSWPWKHPDAWRSFPFGWLFLPVDLIGRPFSQKTRDHFLPLLTSTAWWTQTTMALKRVFQNDNDFKERMFAKQLAVMKGQAWNVVEALKQPDHGPLELTRRTKVCVWDDLVDVPVAVPMQMATSGTEAHAWDAPTRESMDEADIAASAPIRKAKVDDLLGLGSAPVDMPHPGRFEIASPTEEPTSPTSERGKASFGSLERPAHLKHQLPTYHGTSLPSPQSRRQRRYSFTPTLRRSNSSIARQLYDGDDLEGDIGYAAAEGQMGNQRKVIVERLEAVKTSPFFTWC